jgi:trigger factor
LNARLHVKEVKEEQLPAEDDEFASMVNAEESPTFQSLKDRIREDLQTAREDEAEARFRQKAVDSLVEMATLEFPRVLVDREIDHMVRDSTGNDRQTYIENLARIGRTEEQYRETLRPAAEVRAQRSLVLARLAEVEGLEVTGEDIEGELDRLSAPMGENAAQFRAVFSRPEGVGTIRRNLLAQATLDRLAAIARGEAPELPATPAAALPEAEPEPDATEVTPPEPGTPETEAQEEPA